MTQAPRSTRRQLGQFGLALVAAASMVLIQPAAHAQSKKDSVVVGMILEPTSLDPTTAPAAAIGEVVHYNILEGLTKSMSMGPSRLCWPKAGPWTLTAKPSPSNCAKV